MKQANKTEKPTAAERVERRVSAKRKATTPPEAKTQCFAGSEERLERLRAAARKDRKLKFNNLLHHIDESLLHEAYQSLKKRAAAGVDGETWTSYGVSLARNLRQLHKRVHAGRYKAQPVLRKWLDKTDGTKRPLGITCVEDKILQQAMVWVLSTIYEQDFTGFSYGFRPGKSQHDALDALYVAISQRKVSYVLDADIKGFYDHIDQGQLMQFIAHRIVDRRILNLIEQTLQAGIIEEGQWQKSEMGIPQGAVISPHLANVYLHYTFDLWANQWRKRHARGEVYIIRYADDIITCFQYKDDGERFRKALEKRLEAFKLKLHPKKTKLIKFGRFACQDHRQGNGGKPETFDFLGFTHICAEHREGGRFHLRRQTIAKRQSAKLKATRQWLKENRTRPIEVQGKRLRSMFTGIINYFGVPGNRKALSCFRTELCKSWLSALRRRSQKASNLTWNKMQRLIEAWIPKVRTTHPFPNQRLHV